MIHQLDRRRFLLLLFISVVVCRLVRGEISSGVFGNIQTHSLLLYVGNRLYILRNSINLLCFFVLFFPFFSIMLLLLLFFLVLLFILTLAINLRLIGFTVSFGATLSRSSFFGVAVRR